MFKREMKTERIALGDLNFESIPSVIEDLKDVYESIPEESKASAFFNVDSYVEYDCTITELSVQYHRLETEEEMEIRKKLHIDQKKKSIEYSKEHIARLEKELMGLDEKSTQ